MDNTHSSHSFLTEESIDITGLDKATLLINLWKNSKNAVFFQLSGTPLPPQPNLDDAKEQLERNSYVDYFRGRVININFGSNQINPLMYDRDNGKNCFATTVANMRSHQNDDSKERSQKSEFSPITVANWAHRTGRLGSDGQDQVDAMKDFTEGKMTYAEMRERCG